MNQVGPSALSGPIRLLVVLLCPLSCNCGASLVAAVWWCCLGVGCTVALCVAVFSFWLCGFGASYVVLVLVVLLWRCLCFVGLFWAPTSTHGVFGPTGYFGKMA